MRSAVGILSLSAQRRPKVEGEEDVKKQTVASHNLEESRMDQMLYIKCPTTGKSTPTGIAIDKGSFESSMLTNYRTQCQHCPKMHVWIKDDAYYLDGPVA